MPLRRRSCAVAVGALVLTSCGGPRDEGPVPPASDRAPSVTVTFQDGALHTFTPEERDAITAVAESAVEEVRALLPDLDPRIDIRVAAGTTVIPESGEVGAAITAQRVQWMVDPTRPGGPSEVARTQLRSTLFHELHHLARGHVMAGGMGPDGIVGLAISEGMASGFERDAAADRDVLWAQYPDDVDTWVRELLALPDDADPRHWLFDHPDGRRWIGYRAGAYLVDRAMAASGLDAAALVHTPTAEILELAGYG